MSETLVADAFPRARLSRVRCDMAKMPSRATPASSPIPAAVAERAGFSTNGHTTLATPPQDAGESAFDGFLEEIDAPDVVVYLSRQDPMDPREYAHLTQIDAKDFSLEYVKNMYGGGRYKARGRKEGKPYRWLPQVTFSIDSRLYPPRTKPIAVESSVPTPAAQSVSPDVAELRAMVKDLVGTVTAALTTRPATPATDPLDMALKIAEVMKPAAPSHSVAEILTLVESARTNGIKLGEQLADRAPHGDSLLEFAREVTPPILSALNTPKPAASVSAAAAPALALVRTERPAPPAAPSASDMPINLLVPEWAKPLQRWIPQLMLKMQQGKNPSVYAHLLLEELPADVYANVATAAAAPDFVESVLNAVPVLNEPGRREWFAEFLAEVRDTIAADAAAAQTDDLGEDDAEVG